MNKTPYTSHSTASPSAFHSARQQNVLSKVAITRYTISCSQEQEFFTVRTGNVCGFLCTAEKSMTVFPVDCLFRFRPLSNWKAFPFFAIVSKEQDSETTGKSTQKAAAMRACDTASSSFHHGIANV